MAEPRPLLRTAGLQKTFGANYAVKDLSLEVAPGSLHCIIGPNGAGKTTLLNLLTRDVAPDAGDIWFDDRLLTKLKPYQICRLGIGRSYQITSVFKKMTVYENVWVAAYRSLAHGRFNFWATPRRYHGVGAAVHDNLAQVGLERFADTSAAQLSYGDQRLLEMAVTLATRPRLLLLDEPMSGLSGEETKRVSELVRGLVPRYTVVMIDHKMDVVMAISDRITVMDFGEVIAEGDPEAIQADPVVRKAYLGV